MRFMASLATVGTPDPAVYAAEGERFAELIAAGQLTDFFLSAERTRGWTVVHAETQQHAGEIVESLPWLATGRSS